MPPAGQHQQELRVPTALVFPAAARLPVVGLGTWTQRQLGEVQEAVVAAIRLGYRHIDSAADYANEAEVGAAIRQCMDDGIVQRKDLWITSKLQNSDHAPDRVEAACRESLGKLALDHVDLYLMHWPLVTGCTGPVLDPPLQDTWRAMEALVGKGLTRAIGVSNFSAKKLGAMLEGAAIKPAVNQVEAHPYWRNDELVGWCRERDIHVTAYSPLGSPHTASFLKRREDAPVLLQDPTLLAIAERHGRSPADVLVSWAVQRGTSCLPKSTKSEHLRSNLEAASWRLPPDDFDALSSLPTQKRSLDGAWFLSPGGPYRTLEEMWDTPHEERTSTPEQ